LKKNAPLSNILVDCHTYCMKTKDAIMESLDNRQPNTPKAEQSNLLSSNSGVSDCSALGFNNAEPSTQILVETLAELIVEAYFHERTNRSSK